MFNSKHYVPILRWKGAEGNALKNLRDSDKKRLTPLVELIPPRPVLKGIAKTLNQIVIKMPTEISEKWGKNPIFLDLWLIEQSSQVDSLKYIFSAAKKLGLHLIPVLNLKSSPDLVAATSNIVEENKTGLCLRLFCDDISSSELITKINNFLSAFGLNKKDIHLLVDFQISETDCSDQIKKLNNIPNILDWCTFTVASGAFPKDLTNFTLGHHMQARLDWNLWEECLKNSGLIRKPSFSDYTIQHPIYVEPVPGANVSASVRYTVKKHWLVMRGQGVRTEGSAGFAQYPAHARSLSKRDDFCGGDFSSGDAFIAEKAKDLNTKPGNATLWLTAGINHHITFVLDQISNLS